MTAMLLTLVLTGPGWAGSAEDDLAVVKKAVAERPAPAVLPAAPVVAPAGQEPAPPEDPAPAAKAAPRPRPGKEPQWLKVRVVEKAGKRVSVNLPLALVRALGDDWPIDLPCGRCGKERPRMTVGEVLRTLDSGQDLVQIDDEEATVRVWVE